MFTFKIWFFVVAIVLFIIEVIIAVFVNDSFIRPYFGDFLVVILMYCFLKSFLNIPMKKIALFVLLFSYAIEISQYLKFIKILGVQKSKAAKMILGSSFAWNDMVAYTIGILFVIIVEKRLVSGRKKEI